MFISLRRKFVFFALLLALLPLGFAGWSMITLTQDELKSAINDSLSTTAGQLAGEIDYLFAHAWHAPLRLLGNALDNPALGVPEKVALLENGIKSIAGFLALQLYVEGFPPTLLLNDELAAALEHGGIQAEEALHVEWDGIAAADVRLAAVVQVPGTELWALPLRLDLARPIAGQPAYLLAHVDVRQVRELLRGHPFNRSGALFLLTRTDRILYANGEGRDDPPLRNALDLLRSDSRAVTVMPYRDARGQRKLGGLATSEKLPWAVVVMVAEQQAYSTVTQMRRQLLYWVVLGIVVALIMALSIARHITAPLLAVVEVVEKVGGGDLRVRVPPLSNRDELGLLGGRINQMIEGLSERFHLQKFVSGGTLDALKRAGQDGIKLGGERRHATVLFADIRNFTAFSESVPPETVINMLNTYLRAQARAVKRHHGDIDKYVGDQVVAVFQGEHMALNAVRCANDIHAEMALLNIDTPEWDIRVGIGINSGDMVMGAMGSEERMDYTILGDTVNLGARLCHHAGAGNTLISQSVKEQVEGAPDLSMLELEPIRVKGKSQPIAVFAVGPRSKNTDTDTHDPL